MALSSVQVDFIRMNVAVKSGGFLLPSNLIAKAPVGGSFVSDIATKIAQEPRNSISVADATSAVNNALGGNISGVSRYGINAGWIDNVWKPAEVCYPNALITDLTPFGY